MFGGRLLQAAERLVGLDGGGCSDCSSALYQDCYDGQCSPRGGCDDGYGCGNYQYSMNNRNEPYYANQRAYGAFGPMSRLGGFGLGGLGGFGGAGLGSLLGYAIGGGFRGGYGRGMLGGVFGGMLGGMIGRLIQQRFGGGRGGCDDGGCDY